MTKEETIPIWIVWEEIPEEDKFDIISIHKTKGKAVKKCKENPNYYWDKLELEE